MRILAVVAVALLLAGCTSPDGDGPGTDTPSATPGQTTTPSPTTTSPAAPSSIHYAFEEGLDAWSQDSDVPADPNNPGSEVAWTIGTSQNESHGAQTSVRFWLDGRQDDGTIWLERHVQVPDGANVANVSIWAWSGSESFNTLAYLVAHLGPDDPETEEDFPAPGENSGRDDLEMGGLRETLNQAEGWHEYTFDWSIPQDAPSSLVLAFGISAVWETEMTYYVDDVHVSFS